jgi:hypothetical protein
MGSSTRTASLTHTASAETAACPAVTGIGRKSGTATSRFFRDVDSSGSPLWFGPFDCINAVKFGVVTGRLDSQARQADGQVRLQAAQQSEVRGQGKTRGCRSVAARKNGAVSPGLGTVPGLELNDRRGGFDRKNRAKASRTPDRCIDEGTAQPVFPVRTEFPHPKMLDKSAQTLHCG